jgi:sorting nexin-25
MSPLGVRGTDDLDPSLAGRLGRGVLDSIDAEQAHLYEQSGRKRAFVQPICDLFIQVFGLNSSDNWLRGRAIIVVLQQLLGGTIEKKIKDAISAAVTEKSLTEVVQLIRDAVWPGGVIKRPSLPRTVPEKVKSRHDAQLILEQLFRSSSAKIVGSANSRYAARHVFGLYQNDVLNAHLVFTLFDVVLDELFSSESPDHD